MPGKMNAPDARYALGTAILFSCWAGLFLLARWFHFSLLFLFAMGTLVLGVGALQVRQNIRRLSDLENRLVDLNDSVEEKVAAKTARLARHNDLLKEEIAARQNAEGKQLHMQSRLNALWKMARLVDTNLKTLCDHALAEINSMSRSQYAFLGFVDEGEIQMTIMAWSSGVMEDCDLEQDQINFFLQDMGLIGKAVKEKKAMIFNDYSDDCPEKKGIPNGHVAVRRFMVVPVFSQGSVKCLIGVANKQDPYTEQDASQIEGFVSSLHIVLERQKAEDRLKRSEERYRELVEGSSELIARVDDHGCFVFVNHMAEKFFGVAPEKCIGLKITNFVHPDDKERTWGIFSRAIVDKSAHVVLENRQVGMTGGMFTMSWTINFYYGDNGVFVGSSIIGRDVGRQKRAEEDLIKTKKLEATGMLAGGIAHDFNNLLFVIMGNIELIQSMVKLEEKPETFLDQAYQAALRAKDLTRKFITFSSGGDPVKGVGFINQIILEARDLQLSGANITCDCTLAENLPTVIVDKGQMHQVLATLIENAKQAMPDGGVLHIASDIVTAESEHQRMGLEMETGAYVRMMVRDNGQGIQPAHLEKVFDPYFSTRESRGKKGLGLGLSIVHSIVKKHYGYIHIESVWEEGTTVYVYLPASDGVQMKDIQDDDGGGETAPRLLLMDDEEQIRAMSREILVKLGYRVEVVTCGEEAVDCYKKALESGSPFDAVLLDLTIKGGMGGIDTIKQLTAIHPGVKGIILSGYTSNPAISNFKTYGFKSALIKPVAIHRLHETIKKVISQ